MTRRKKSRERRDSVTRQPTPLEQHARHKKTLIPPLARLPNLSLSSWMNERLPEMLWACLIVSSFDRPTALALFRELGDHAYRMREWTTGPDVTLSGIAAMDCDLRRGTVEALTTRPECAIALRPLMLLHDLPARDEWQTCLPAAVPEEDWDRLGAAVAATLDHQSQPSTDCRWARVVFKMAAGFVYFPPELQELAKQIIAYPDAGDMHAVRPGIRSLEGAMDLHGPGDLVWPNAFWRQCLCDTACVQPRSSDSVTIPVVGSSLAKVNHVHAELVRHCAMTRTTTAVDARHDTTFGLGFYSLCVLSELLSAGVATFSIGCLALRCLAEITISLAFLAKKDDAILWQSYRTYGSGQAKLSYLRLEQSQSRPKFMDKEAIERLANEDMWHEFLKVELGHWAKADLRKLSEVTGLKDIYDNYYQWPSTFMHGHWCAVRLVCFDTCFNPLHRLHRIPRREARLLPDIVADACLLVDRTLTLISSLYPTFPERVGSGSA